MQIEPAGSANVEKPVCQRPAQLRQSHYEIKIRGVFTFNQSIESTREL